MNRKMLSEGTIRRFMRLANITPLTNTFLEGAVPPEETSGSEGMGPGSEPANAPDMDPGAFDLEMPETPPADATANRDEEEFGGGEENDLEIPPDVADAVASLVANALNDALPGVNLVPEPAEEEGEVLGADVEMEDESEELEEKHRKDHPTRTAGRDSGGRRVVPMEEAIRDAIVSVMGEVATAPTAEEEAAGMSFSGGQSMERGPIKRGVTTGYPGTTKITKGAQHVGTEEEGTQSHRPGTMSTPRVSGTSTQPEVGPHSRPASARMKAAMTPETATSAFPAVGDKYEKSHRKYGMEETIREAVVGVLREYWPTGRNPLAAMHDRRAGSATPAPGRTHPTGYLDPAAQMSMPGPPGGRPGQVFHSVGSQSMPIGVEDPEALMSRELGPEEWRQYNVATDFEGGQPGLEEAVGGVDYVDDEQLAENIYRKVIAKLTRKQK